MKQIKQLLVFILLLTMMATSFATVQTLSNNDGTAELYGAFTGPWTYRAELFDVNGTYKISQVQSYWGELSGNVAFDKYRFWIYNASNNAVLYASGYQNLTTANAFAYANLTTPLLVSDDFFVVFNAPATGGKPKIGADTSSTSGYTFSAPSTYVLQLNRAYMFNVVIDDNIAPVLENVSAPNVVVSKAFFNITADTFDVNGDTVTLVCEHGNDMVTIASSQCTSADASSCTIKATSGNNFNNSIYCRAYDGEYYSDEVEVLYDDDNKKPQVSLKVGKAVNANNAYSNNGSVVLTPQFGDAHLDYCDVTGDFTSSNISETPISLGVLADGTYTYNVTCVDVLGFSKSSVKSITVDTKDPDVNDFNIDVETIDLDGIIEIDWDISDDTSGVKTTRLQYKYASSINGSVNASGFKNLFQTTNTSVTEFVTQALSSQTSFTFRLQVCDFAGNCEYSDELVTFTNTNAPYVIISNIGAGDIFATAKVLVEADYADDSDVDCSLEVDGATNLSMSGDGLLSGTASRQTPSLTDGQHNVTVFCNDGVGDSEGNTSSSSVSFFVDTHKPQVTLEAGNAVAIPSPYANKVWVNVSYDDLNNGYESGLDTCTIDWDDGKTTTFTTFDSIWKHSYKDEGKYDIRITCEDAAGNSGTAVDSIKVDKTKPITTVSLSDTASCNIWSKSDVEVTLTAKDNLGLSSARSGVDFTKYRIVGKQGWTEYTAPFTISDDGVWSVEFYSKDNALNQEKKQNITVLIDREAPIADISNPLNTEHLGSKNVSFYGTTFDSTSGTESVDVTVYNPNGSIAYSESVTNFAFDTIWAANWTAQENTEYVVEVIATDAACNVQAVSYNHTITVVDFTDIFYTENEVDAQLIELETQLRDLIDSNNASVTADLVEIRSLMDAINTNLSNQIDNLDAGLSAAYLAISGLNQRVDLMNTHYMNLFVYVFGELTDLDSDVDSLNQSISVLEAKLTALGQQMNHGTINVFHKNRDDENQLRVWGEAPAGADYATVRMCTPTQGCGAGKIVAVDNVTGINANNPNKYSTWINLSDFEKAKYNVRVQFFDEYDQYMRGYDVGTLFYGLDGFGITVSDDDEDLSVIGLRKLPKITYVVEVDETFVNAVFVLRNTNNTFEQVIREQSLFIDRPYLFGDSVQIPTFGEDDYYVEINGTGWKSETFTISVENPDESFYLVGPSPNKKDELWIMPESVFNISAVLRDYDSAARAAFVISVFNDTTAPSIYSAVGRIPLETNGTGVFTSLNVGSDFDFADENTYVLEATTNLDIVYVDSITLYVDGVAPTIAELVPDAGAYSGILVPYVNVSDSESGIESVWITLESKTNSSLRFTLEATLNATTGLYTAEFDTVEMNMPDDSYDVIADVTDFAGNFQTLTVDPIIDNTNPVISSLSIDNVVYNDDYRLLIRATVSDALSGVDKVYALLTGPNTTNITATRVNLTSVGTNLYRATFTNNTLVSGNYTVDLFVSDLAGNNASANTTEAVSVETRPVIPPPTPSSGGRGGSGGVYVPPVNNTPQPIVIDSIAEPTNTGGSNSEGVVVTEVAQTPEEQGSLLVEESDDTTTPSGQFVGGSDSDSSGSWIWLTIAGLGIIGLLVWFVLSKK